MHKLVKNVFLALGISLLSFGLYLIFFGYGTSEGAVSWGAERMEIPIAEYYVKFGRDPSLDVNVALDNAVFQGGADYTVH